MTMLIHYTKEPLMLSAAAKVTPRIGHDIKRHSTTTSLSLTIVQFYVHVDFMQSRRDSLSHRLQRNVTPFADALQLNERV